MSEEYLMDLQRSIQEQGHAWSAGETPLSTLPPEIQDRRLGLRVEPDELERLATAIAQASLMAAEAAAEFPGAWDWRDVGGADWTTAIRDQENCGSCVAFGTVAVLEAMLKRHENDASLQPNLSEAHLFFCGCGNCCDRGWWPTNALDYAKNYGVPDEACFPYQDHDMPCEDTCQDWQSLAVRVVDWQEVLDVDSRKVWLSSTGPMVGCMAVYRDFFSYTKGVYRHTTGSLAGYHAIGVVGYSEDEQCWICKNSWGPGWGESGWFKIGYGEAEIDTRFAMYGVEDVIPPSPEPPPPPPPPPPPDGCLQQILRLFGGAS